MLKIEAIAYAGERKRLYVQPVGTAMMSRTTDAALAATVALIQNMSVRIFAAPLVDRSVAFCLGPAAAADSVDTGEHEWTASDIH